MKGLAKKLQREYQTHKRDVTDHIWAMRCLEKLLLQVQILWARAYAELDVQYLVTGSEKGTEMGALMVPGHGRSTGGSGRVESYPRDRSGQSTVLLSVNFAATHIVSTVQF